MSMFLQSLRPRKLFKQVNIILNDSMILVVHSHKPSLKQGDGITFVYWEEEGCEA